MSAGLQDTNSSRTSSSSRSTRNSAVPWMGVGKFHADEFGLKAVNKLLGQMRWADSSHRVRSSEDSPVIVSWQGLRHIRVPPIPSSPRQQTNPAHTALPT